MSTLNTILEKLHYFWNRFTRSITGQAPVWEEYEEHYLISKTT